MNVIEIDNLRLDRDTREVTINGNQANLTRKEFDILWTLSMKPGGVVPRKDMLLTVWGVDVVVEPRTVDAHIAHIRRILSEYRAHSPRIETVWGIGYRLSRVTPMDSRTRPVPMKIPVY